MATKKPGDDIYATLESSDFSLTREQKVELKVKIGELLTAFQIDKNLIDEFLNSPYQYLMENHPISFLEGMDRKFPNLVFSFNQVIERLRIELRDAQGNCIACILSLLAIIYAAFLHIGCTVDFLKAIIVEVTLELISFLDLDEDSKEILDEILKMSTAISPLKLSKHICRKAGICTKVKINLEMDTNGGNLSNSLSGLLTKPISTDFLQIEDKSKKDEGDNPGAVKWHK